MSETVKVIIEIPKEIYERCKEYKLWSYDAETLEGAVARGTPLDDVKAEIIDKAIKDSNGEGFIFLGRLLRIFDNIGKVESEEV